MCFKRKSYKYIVFILNTMTSICGIFLIGSSIAQYKNNFPLKSTRQLAIMTGSGGFFIFINANMGCCASFLGNKWMIKLNAYIFCALIVYLISVGSLAVVFYRNTFGLDVQIELDQLFFHFNYHQLSNWYQRSAQCCGLNSVEDWQDSIPRSCCHRSSKCTKLNAYNVGCKASLLNATRVWCIVISTFCYLVSIELVIVAIYNFLYAKSKEEDSRKSDVET